MTPSDSCRAGDPLASSDGQMVGRPKMVRLMTEGDDRTLLSEKSDRDDPDVPVDGRQTFLETSRSSLH